LKFVRAGGKVLPGLQRRRIAERLLYVKHHDTGDAGDD
jgi:GH24 family phage-related lysozyme (muramidase)